MRPGAIRPHRIQPTTPATPSTISVWCLDLHCVCGASFGRGAPIEHRHGSIRSGRIPATGVPGMAATDPADSAPTPDDGAALLNAFDKILAATGHKPAVVPQPRTDQPLIAPHCRHQSPAGPQPRAPHQVTNPLAPRGRRHARGSCSLQPGRDIDLSRFNSGHWRGACSQARDRDSGHRGNVPTSKSSQRSPPHAAARTPVSGVAALRLRRCPVAGRFSLARLVELPLRWLPPDPMLPNLQLAAPKLAAPKLQAVVPSPCPAQIGAARRLGEFPPARLPSADAGPARRYGGPTPGGRAAACPAWAQIPSAAPKPSQSPRASPPRSAETPPATAASPGCGPPLPRCSGAKHSDPSDGSPEVRGRRRPAAAPRAPSSEAETPGRIHAGAAGAMTCETRADGEQPGAWRESAEMRHGKANGPQGGSGGPDRPGAKWPADRKNRWHRPVTTTPGGDSRDRVDRSGGTGRGLRR